MSRNARHEIIMNGIDSEAYIQRTLVLDNEFHPRHVHKLHKCYEKRLERTSQIAYANDYVIETITMLATQTQTLRYYQLTGPKQVASGHSQLCREEITDETLIGKLFLHVTKHLEGMESFLALVPGEEIKPAILPNFWGWNGAIGIIEEKQSSYILDLLGGTSVAFMENMAMSARYSKRNHIEPYNRYPLPAELNISHQPTSGEINPDPESLIYWVLFLRDGSVETVGSTEVAQYQYNPDELRTAIKLYINAYPQEGGAGYGLMLEIFDGNLIPLVD